MSTESITLHEDMGGNPLYQNPNVYTVNAKGESVQPKHGVECFFQAKVKNNGTEEAKIVNVTFYLCIPGAGVVWPDISHGSASTGSLASGASTSITCNHAWIPDSSKSSHQCIVAVVSCFGCPAPPVVAGDRVDAANKQIGQHNVNVAPPVTKTTDVSLRYLNVINPESAGYVQITREPLSKNAAILQSKGIAPSTPEAPGGEKLSIVREQDGEVSGAKMLYEAGKTIALHTKIEFDTIKPGTAAIYHIQQYEHDQLVGGVCQVVLHA